MDVHWEALIRWLLWPVNPTFWFLAMVVFAIFGLRAAWIRWAFRAVILATAALFSLGQITRFPELQADLVEAGFIRDQRFEIAEGNGRVVTISDVWNDPANNFGGRVGIAPRERLSDRPGGARPPE